MDQRSDDDRAVWQWMHSSGWRNYSEDASKRIEDAYQKGFSQCRLKAGKKKTTPMELFFVDMLQYDPTTGNTRKIRRVGPTGFMMHLKIQAGVVGRMMDTGKLRRTHFEDFQGKRRQIMDERLLDDHSSGRNKGRMSQIPNLNETAWAAPLVTSPLFFCISMSMVFVNSLWIGIDADDDSGTTLYESSPYKIVIENMFCIYFFAELFLNVSVLQRMRQIFHSSWLTFDLTLVFLMVCETWLVPLVLFAAGVQGDSSIGVPRQLAVLRIVRLLRLTRLGRIVRLLRWMPEVMMMLKGIAAALRSVFTTILMLVVLLYVFAIIFKSQSEDNEALREFFPTVLGSMYRLLMHGSFLDNCTDAMDLISTENQALATVFLCFIILSSFMVLNMLVGILCDVVREVSLAEKDKTARTGLKTMLLGVLEAYDKEDDEHIAHEEFTLLLTNPEIHGILTRFGVDVNDLMSLKDVLFQDKKAVTSHGQRVDNENSIPLKKLSFAEFIEVVMRLRGGNNASVTDIVDLREYVRQRFDHLDWKMLGGHMDVEAPWIGPDERFDHPSKALSERLTKMSVGSRSAHFAGVSAPQSAQTTTSFTPCVAFEDVSDGERPVLAPPEGFAETSSDVASDMSVRIGRLSQEVQALGDRQSQWQRELLEQQAEWQRGVLARQTAMEDQVRDLRQQVARIGDLLAGGATLPHRPVA